MRGVTIARTHPPHPAQARGVFDPHRRQQLVSIAQSLVADSGGGCGGAPAAAGVAGEAAGGEGGALPGVPTTWDMHSSSPEVGWGGDACRVQTRVRCVGAGLKPAQRR